MNGKDGIIVFSFPLSKDEEYQRDGTFFFCGTDACKPPARRRYTLMWMFIGKQMDAFQYQQLFRAVSPRGCSLNDNGFMLACYRRGSGDWHRVQSSRP